MKWFLPIILGAWACCAAQTLPQTLPPKAPEVSAEEQADLDVGISAAGNSPLEFLRAVEKHLVKYPNSPRKTELERAAASAAIAANDDARIVWFGERVLAGQPDDLQILGRVTHSLLTVDSKEAAARAIKYARRTQELLLQLQKDTSRNARPPADFMNQTDRALGRSFADEARATEYLGRPEEALAVARRGFAVWPNAESAREIARCYERLGKPAEAVRALADAFTIQDAHNTDADRARDRGRLGELYRGAHGSESGLGDQILEAYDRNLAVIHARELHLRQNDPNASLTNPMDFTLSGLDGNKLNLATLKGKVLVLDVWATWCGPCREQHPLYDQVKQRFRDNPDVVFLSINADEDHAPVRLFLDEMKWHDTVYFEDGLGRALAIDSLPVALLIDRHGQVFTRMNGFIRERFVDMISEAIRDALVR